MGALSPAHLVILLVIALLVIGPGKLPDTGAALGRAIREFRHAVSDDLEDPASPSPAGPGAPVESAAPAEAPTRTS